MRNTEAPWVAQDVDAADFPHGREVLVWGETDGAVVVSLTGPGGRRTINVDPEVAREMAAALIRAAAWAERQATR